MPKNDIKTKREQIYDKLSRVLTDYETGDNTPDDLYDMLREIQRNWECTITASND